MSKDVIMPALGMAQETGTLLRWLKAPGDTVVKGEMLMEVETDKAMVEVEATASGILSDVTAQPGDIIPVGHVIGRIISPDDVRKEVPTEHLPRESTRISPVAARIAAEHGIDLQQIKTPSGVIQKQDVLAYVRNEGGRDDALTYIADEKNAPPSPVLRPPSPKVLASPKARRLATERGVELKQVPGSGPDGAVLAADVLAIREAAPAPSHVLADTPESETLAVSNVWRVMVERLSQAWTTIPHFYLVRDVNASRLIAWRDAKKAGAVGSAVEKITYTDLLVKLVSAALQKHPRVNASFQNNEIILHRSINIGLAVAVEQGLVVPVIHNAHELSLATITSRRAELIERAHAGRLSVKDISGGTFTISNLGMYGVDAFNAIVNPPQAAILAVSRIAERVVPVNHQPSVQPMMTLTLSCDHRVIDGARGAQFLDTLAQFIEEPLSLLD
jgi:pyruvate dehydrogenase E2 component (dihydrolipoamide acetyltransferase)